MAQHSILIVGGGIGGLAAALALSKQGFAVKLFEQASEFAEIGAGIQLGPNVFKMFDFLGIAEKVKRRAVFPESLTMMDAITGEKVTSIPVGKDFEHRFGQPYAVIHRADLHGVLLEECVRSDLVHLQTSTKIGGVDETGDGVTLTSTDGREFKGAAVVGADGLWSTIRAAIVGDGKPVASGHVAYRAVLPAKEMPKALQWWSMTIWAGDKTHLVHYPLRGGDLFNLVAVFQSDKFTEGWDAYGDKDELFERFDGKCPEVCELLGKIEDWRMWVLCDRQPIKEWSRGRITLLGDAAHPMLQYLAQGANMAIEDAVCLAGQLATAEGDVAKAFESYQALRYMRTGRVQMMARLYGEVFHATGVLRELRNSLLGARSPAQAYDAMAWLYDVPEPEPLRAGTSQ